MVVLPPHKEGFQISIREPVEGQGQNPEKGKIGSEGITSRETKNKREYRKEGK